jgi:uncharacterized membrane protein YraQ (UPF0718 family)
MTSPLGDAVVVAEKAALARPWVKLALYAVAGIAVAIFVGVIVYRLFFQGQDLARARGNGVVAAQQQKADDKTVTEALGTQAHVEAEHQRVDVVVTQARSRIDEAWHGETVGNDVDRAGRAALCSLHDSLCGLPAPAQVQPLRPPGDAGGDAARPGAG